MEPTTYGWLVLAFPLAGSLLIAFGYRVLPGRSAGWIGTAAIGLSFLASLGMLVAAARPARRGAPAHELALRLRLAPAASTSR